MSKQFRYDKVEVHKDAVELLPFGAKKYKASFAKADNIQLYRDENGVFVREFRPAAEVFSDTSMKSFQNLPVTDDHPPEMITPDNYNKYLKGVSGEIVTKNGNRVDGFVIIYDKNLQQKIDTGLKVQMSMGYWVQKDNTPGVFNGMHYDAVQRNIIGNHNAVVEVGRAGSDVRIRFDSIDYPVCYQVDSIEEDNKDVDNKVKNKGVKKMAQVNIDGVSYEIPDNVADKVALKVKLADEAKTNKDALEAVTKERDTLKGEKAALESSINSLKANADSNSIENAIKAIREAVVDAKEIVSKLGVKLPDNLNFDAMTDVKAIKKAVLALGNVKLDDNASDDTIQGSYTTLKSLVANNQSKTNQDSYNSFIQGINTGLNQGSQNNNTASILGKMIAVAASQGGK